MTVDWYAKIEKALVGKGGSIKRREYDWVLNLSGGGAVTLPLPWRVRVPLIGFALWSPKVY